MPAYECLYKTNTIIEKKINGWVGPDGEGIAANKCPAYMETPSTLFETHPDAPHEITTNSNFCLN